VLDPVPDSVGIAHETIQQTKADIAEAHRLYQLADYDGAAQLLPSVLMRVGGGIDRGNGPPPLHLLEAERVAEQAVSRNAAARALLTTLLAGERKSATPGLRSLATRAGVLQ
jgi:hypothetical protein